MPGTFAIVKLQNDAKIPSELYDKPFFSLTRTEEELSLVCHEEEVSAGMRQNCSEDWQALRIDGPLDLDQVGILSGLLQPLSRAGISVYTISTYETDYLFIKTTKMAAAIETLQNRGHIVQAV